MSESEQTGVHQGMSVNDMMDGYIHRLQKENSELRARIEGLSFAICYTINNSTIQTSHPTECVVMTDALIERPELSLAKIEAAAVEKFINRQYKHRVDVEEIELWKIIRDGENYANQLRQREKTNE